MYPSLLAGLFSLVGIVSAVTWDATPFNPLSFPLAVRSPYTSAWLPGGGNGGNLAGQWPQFWNGATLGWAGYVRVDGTSYIFLGNPNVPNESPALASQTSSKVKSKPSAKAVTVVNMSLQFTSTQSIFTLNAGPVTLTANFLSPIEPNDLLRQSLPFAYFSVSVAANDGGTHSVQVYSDISAEWVSSDTTQTVNWTTTLAGDMTVHQTMMETQTVYGEYNDLAQYGAAYYAVNGACTYQTGADVDVRAQFLNNGVLANTLDIGFRAVSDRWPVFAHAFDLGSVGSTATQPVVWAVGHARDPAIEYITKAGLQNRRSYYFTQYSSMMDVLSFFLGDFSNAISSATAFDAQVQADALKVSQDYANVVAISARQAFGATELTFGSDANDIMMFMKEISSDGNVNTVDVIFPAYPIFLYTNPALARYLLEPLFQYQETGLYPNAWSVHDMGSNYPKALGHNDGNDEKMPVEESGNMVIMTAAYIKATNDVSIATSYYNLLQQWTSFLINDSLIPANQISTDDFAGALANQTNLAIKGIVGIAGMSQIATATGDSSGSQTYLATAQSYVPQFQGFATSANGTHLDLSYGDDASWGLVYNLFADKLLGTNIFPQSIYEMETAWYPGVAQAYGVPLDTRHLYTKTDWEIFTSTIMTSTTARDLFISSVAKFQEAGLSNAPFPDLYESDSGDADGFRARPVAGGHFAHLALMKLGTGN